MCGNVGIFNPKGITPNQQDLFEQMLWMDSIRGYHSTGVIAVSDEGEKYSVIKDAVDGALFVQTKQWAEFLKEHKKPKVLIGHNRWATQGKVNRKNSHPFSFGNISGVHNGTLTHQYGLPDHEKFDVDSENIYWSFYKKGVEWTLERLDGAFALVWYDSKEKALNFVRNDERPLHIAELNDGTIIWGSEKGMLEWLTGRTNKVSSIKTIENLKDGVWRKFHLSGGMLDKPVEIQDTWKQYRSFGGWGQPTGAYYLGNSNGKQGTVTRLSSHKEADNKLLINAGLDWRVGRRIKVEMEEFVPYANGTESGSIHCYSDDLHPEDDVVVTITGKSRKEFTVGEEVTGVITYVYPIKDTPGIKVALTDIKAVTENLPALTILPKETVCGSSISKAHFDNHMRKKCHNCGDNISFDDLENCAQINETNLICGHCVEGILNV